MLGFAEWHSFYKPCVHAAAASELFGTKLKAIAAELPPHETVQELATAHVVQQEKLFVVSDIESSEVLLSFATATDRVGIMAVHGKGYTCCKCNSGYASPCQHVKALCLWLELHEDEAPPILQDVMSDVVAAISTSPGTTNASGPVSTSRIPFLVATPAAQRRSTGGTCERRVSIVVSVW